MGSIAWLLIGIAILAALATRSFRRIQASRRAALAMRLPGSAPESAIEVRNFTEADEQILGLTCACGGGFRPVGERSIEVDDVSMRVALLECGRCESERLMYFVEPPTMH